MTLRCCPYALCLRCLHNRPGELKQGPRSYFQKCNSTRQCQALAGTKANGRTSARRCIRQKIKWAKAEKGKVKVGAHDLTLGIRAKSAGTFDQSTRTGHILLVSSYSHVHCHICLGGITIRAVTSRKGTYCYCDHGRGSWRCPSYSPNSTRGSHEIVSSCGVSLWNVEKQWSHGILSNIPHCLRCIHITVLHKISHCHLPP